MLFRENQILVIYKFLVELFLVTNNYLVLFFFFFIDSPEDSRPNKQKNKRFKEVAFYIDVQLYCHFDNITSSGLARI